MARDLDIIIVNWNVRDMLAACLRSIAEQGTLEKSGTLRIGQYSCGVIVVDNASSDDSVAMLQNEFPWVITIASDRNLGFGRGNNIGVKRSSASLVLILNPDTEPKPNALVTMLDTLAAHRDVGVVGPQLRYGDGSLQSSRRRFPTVMTAIFESTLLGQWFPNNRWARAYHVADRSADEEQDVDWLVGACLLVRRKVIEDVGVFDPSFFMYSEEMDWCKRIRHAGWRVLYQPRAIVVHYEGQSSGQVRSLREIYFGSSKAYYFAKHHGRFVGSLVRYMLLSDTLAKWAIEALKWLVGHKRTLRRERMHAYGQVLRSGLVPACPREEMAP